MILLNSVYLHSKTTCLMQPMILVPKVVALDMQVPLYFSQPIPRSTYAFQCSYISQQHCWSLIIVVKCRDWYDCFPNLQSLRHVDPSFPSSACQVREGTTSIIIIINDCSGYKDFFLVYTKLDFYVCVNKIAQYYAIFSYCSPVCQVQEGATSIIL